MSDFVVKSPIAGFACPLDEVEDEVFAGRMLGDGLAVDPTEGLLRAPCDGVVTTLPATAHAVTVRSDGGVEILLHVGLDTVALKGSGFEPLVRAGQAVRAGEPLIRFGLDAVARAAKSLVTPVVVTDPARFRIAWRHAPGPVLAGDTLLTVRAAEIAPVDAVANGGEAGGSLVITLPHGLHARPAALLAQSLRQLRAEATLTLRDRSANARSAVALLSLGARHGDVLTVTARGPDAGLVAGRLEQALARMHAPSPGAEVAPAPAAPAGRPSIASPGIAIGPAVQIARSEPAVPEHGAGAASEMGRFDAARARLAAKLLRLAQGDSGHRAGIVGAHLEFLEDPELLARSYRAIGEGKSAGFAWRASVGEALRLLGSLEDGHLAARADDLRDLELQLLEILDGTAKPEAPRLPAHAILVARDLLPSQFLALDATRVAGICTTSRATTSHVAILAGAAGIPMLAGVEAALLAVADGTMLLLDAERGHVSVAPDADVTAEAASRIAARARATARLRTAAALDCRTADGERIEVFANVGSTAEAAAAVAAGAEGCGLLRTEFLFLDRLEPPGREEQAMEYQAIVDAFAGRPVIVRTLDAGSDKPIPFLAMPAQENPALGLRGIRASLWRPELLREQVAAILSVRPAGRCRILLPMVNEADEIQAVRAMVRELAPLLHVNADIPVGIMVETPAAAVTAARLAAHADFLSIGTNDLAQYVLAIDRTNPLLAGHLDALHPAVLNLVASVCAAARAAGRGVAVCGSLASEPAAAPLLVGLGVGELSAVPGAIPAIKDAVRGRSLAQCRTLAARALAADSAAAVRAMLSGSAAGDAP